MADYWKSNPRRWCDFCKCWLEDNKPVRFRAVEGRYRCPTDWLFQSVPLLMLAFTCPHLPPLFVTEQSIQYHEKGVKHKKNVEEHIKQARARGTAKLAEDEATRQQLEAINKAALEAMGRDAEADPNLHASYVAAARAARAAPKPASAPAAAALASAPVAAVAAVVEGEGEVGVVAEAPKDETTGLGVWQTVEVTAEERQQIDEDQQRLEAKRARMEARAERRRKEKTVEFGVKEVDTLDAGSGTGTGTAGGENAMPAFKKRKTEGKQRQIRRKDDSDDE
jgi:WW domain-binding protein 4